MTPGFDVILVQGSVIGRMDPRWKLVSLTVAAFSIAFHRALPPALVALLLAWLLVLIGRIPQAWFARRAGMVALFVGLFVVWLPFMGEGPACKGPAWEIGPLQLSKAGSLQGLHVLIKALAIFSLMLVVWSTAAVESTMKAAHALHVPGLVVQLLALTYRYIFLVGEELRRLRIALRARGYRNRANLHSYKTIGHVAGSLLVRGYERAERVSQAMRCRAFDGNFRSLADFQTRRADVAFFAGVVVLAGALLTWDILLYLPLAG